VTLQHVSFRALALGLPDREVLCDSQAQEHVSLRALSLGLHEREVLYVTLDEHISLRALALGLPNREVLYVARRSTFRLGC
jgi:hypothetical protein